MNWTIFRDAIIKQLKGAAVKAVLKKFLISGGIKGFLISFIVEEAFEEIAEPILKAVGRKIGYLVDRVEGSIVISKIEDARDEHNPENYDSSVDAGYK